MAIQEVFKGKKYVCAEVKNALIQQEFEAEHPPADLNSLTSRELEVAVLIKKGLKSREIGAKLHISLKTVEVHRHNILKKLKLKNIAELINSLNIEGL